MVRFVRTPLKFPCFIFVLTLLNTLGVGSLRAQVNDDNQPSRQAEPPKITVGAVEEVILKPWGVSFAARVDTGADLSSLDARDVVVRNNVAEFSLGKRWGSQRIQLPVVEWRRIQTALGTETRPVVEISICLGSKLFRTPVTLKDRSEMRYPFLVGRTALNGKFLVDPSRSQPVGHACPAQTLASSQGSPEVGQ